MLTRSQKERFDVALYEYRASGKKSCARCSTPFEVFQSMSAEPQKRCEDCGAPVQRLFSAPAIHGKGTRILSNKNLAEKGFTKYVKAGDGHFEKAAGEGPDLIKR